MALSLKNMSQKASLVKHYCQLSFVKCYFYRLRMVSP